MNDSHPAWDNLHMCGRFVQVEKPEFYAEHFGAEFVRTETLQTNYNVAPTEKVYAVAEHDGDRALTSFRWGLVPFWAKDKKIGSRSINARSETAATKPTFKSSFERRRCLIPADGFYEWQRKEAGKLPHYITSAEGTPLPLAGLWASWKDPETEEKLLTCTILTGKPNSLMEPIHDRMPIILPKDKWSAWLDPGFQDVDALSGLMHPLPSDQLKAYPVSTLVNKVANKTADLITPLTTGAVDLP
ncbi:MAG: SOS response-associated peptidase [Acidimicrobiia bacterium]